MNQAKTAHTPALFVDAAVPSSPVCSNVIREQVQFIIFSLARNSQRKKQFSTTISSSKCNGLGDHYRDRGEISVASTIILQIICQWKRSSSSLLFFPRMIKNLYSASLELATVSAPRIHCRSRSFDALPPCRTAC